MKTSEKLKHIGNICKPRSSVFDTSRKDTVLDITDLIDNKINAQEFFAENFITDGMRRLFKETFRRFEGNSQQGIFVLSQAMGGGKTHNMIALGLLAQNKDIRSNVLKDIYSDSLDKVRVVGFTGRESDAPLGIWGSIAEQLGKKELFNNYYSPLSAPGQSAWINLLKGEPTLILLDELPPYFEAGLSRPIGDSNLASVTTTALSNLLSAVAKEELSNVCVVISDLKATYEGGSQQINRALENLRGEVGRGAMTLEPVALNTDEIYNILRTRLFDELPNENDIGEISQAYAQSVSNAKQMDITNASPEKFAAQIKESYPFHFSMRDLYARFRENPGFQQTRGFIRLMRAIVKNLYETKRSEETFLIHPYNIDLNDREVLSEITSINPTLDNAIAHDIASSGSSEAEKIDADFTIGTDAQDVCKLLLVSSLANIPNAVRGLTLSEIVSFICAPGRDVSQLKKVIDQINTRAWYLHSSSDGKLFFRNVENLNAKIKSIAEGMNRESSLKELRIFLESIFSPSLKDCYQEVYALKPVDEVALKQDKVSLFVYEPYHNGGLHEDLRRFYDDQQFKNRVLFLTGARGNIERIIDKSAELKAIKKILDEMQQERIPDTDPQKLGAQDLQDKYTSQLLMLLRETFTTLYYPHKDGLLQTDFMMNFTDNNYNGEKQIREALKNKQKFTEETNSDTFRKKCEQRLFTQRAMPYSEVKKRAATNTLWQWHHPRALDDLKADMIKKNYWVEEGNYVDKEPPKPETSIRAREINRDDEGNVTLKITPDNGDIVYYEYGTSVTSSSSRVTDFNQFKTNELVVSFLCEDSKGEHKTGEPCLWKNKLVLKSRVYDSGNDKMIEFKVAPHAQIKYTTDGSNPQSNGVSYEGPFPIPEKTLCIQAIAERDGITSDVHRKDIKWDQKEEFQLDPVKPVTWLKKQKFTNTKDTYEFLDRLNKFEAKAFVYQIVIEKDNWMDLTTNEKISLESSQINTIIEQLRGIIPDGEITLEVKKVTFSSGQKLLDWIAETKMQLPKQSEVSQ